ncbi:MAG: 30S ribosomal protein S4 [Mariprofundaceae bacterium]|nr:30S ribosomal protein S4 [Mariprofundaceae bacterium]
MARYLDAKCRLCRREGEKLFLKGSKCFSDKCGIERRPYPPGMHGQRRRVNRGSDYGLQLREKQKVKRMYGLQEKQFKRCFHDADNMAGVTGLNLLHILESRLDNVVFRMGLAISRNEARQLIRHKHIMVNGGLVTIPSYRMTVGTTVEIVSSAKEQLRVKAAVEEAGKRGVSEWLDTDLTTMKGTYKSHPAREQLDQGISEQLIVELYSK